MKRKQTLSAGININQLIGALTDPNQRFEFPVKPFTIEMDLSRKTKSAFIAAGVLMGTGFIISQLIKNSK